MVGTFSTAEKGERVGLFTVEAEKNFFQKILFDKEVVVFRGLVKIQIVYLAAVDHVKTAGKHGVGVLSDLMNPASAKKIDDFDKVVGMTVGGDIADIFFDQHAFFVDEVCAFFINSHENLSL